ncbi:hypothetical protein K1719_021789 [Acacia pycnantha]|nr:hypothetical protein K1719_021789 [Acacia pycnantha]
MMVCSFLNLNDMRLTTSTLEDRIVFTLLERTVYSYHHSFYNTNVSLDDENEGEMLRRVVSKTENFQAAFNGFKLPEMQSISFQVTSNCKIQRLNLKLKMQSLSFQRSINVPTPLASSQPSRALSRSSCLNLKDMRLTASTLEDHIIFTLLECTVYSYHHSLYNMNVSLNHENKGEMLRRVVSKTENFQAAFDIFKLPEEMSFFPDNLLEERSNPDATVGSPPLVLDPVATSLDMNNKLCSLYNICIFNFMKPKVENDGRQDSALPCDVSCIQAISKRVPLGKFLAEAKFQMSTDKFKEDVKAQNIQLLNDALVCHKHRDAAAKRYIDMENAIGYEQRTLAANVCMYLVLPFVEEMEKEYIVAKLS